VGLTVSEDKLSNASNVHSNGTEKVVIATQSDERSGWNSSSQAAEDEHGRRVWDQEPHEAQQSRVTQSFGQITTRGAGLKEKTFVVLRTHGDGDLTAQGRAMAVAIALDNLMLGLVVHFGKRIREEFAC